MEIARQMKGRNLYFLLLVGAAVIVYFVPLRSLLSFAWRDDTFSYIPLMPLVSAYLFYERRKEILQDGVGVSLVGIVPISLAIVLYAFGASQAGRLAALDSMTITTLSFVLCVVGGLGLFYGVGALKAAVFPMLFLLFMAPIPTILLDRVMVFLQSMSAEVASFFFRLTGVPVYRDGFVFQLPGQTIEVAKQCSGIRSSISLFLVSLLAGHLFLKTNWRRTVLCLSIVPITIVKNAVRIVTLSLLTVYVDPRILGSVAHRRGGIPIFLLALVLLGVVLWFLRRSETNRSDGDPGKLR